MHQFAGTGIDDQQAAGLLDVLRFQAIQHRQAGCKGVVAQSGDADHCVTANESQTARKAGA